jgi:uncharacterized membrane protein YkvA (DUF1232 family)
MNSSNNQVEFKQLQSFPASLFDRSKYDGAKTLVAMFFLLATIYFATGFFGFIIDQNQWLHDMVYGSPKVIEPSQWWEFWKGNVFSDVATSALTYVDILVRFFIFVVAYCFAWATFDPKNVEGYIMGILNTALGIIYCLSPLDVIPDALPIAGSFDDIFFGVGMVALGISGWHRNQLRDDKTKTVITMVNQGNIENALQLLLEDKGMTINLKKDGQ